jgi:hypothetical protein
MLLMEHFAGLEFPALFSLLPLIFGSIPIGFSLPKVILLLNLMDGCGWDN